MLKHRAADDNIDDCEIDKQENSETKELVKDIYKNIETLYGVYDPNHKSKFISVFLICVIAFFIATPFGVIIWNLIAHKFQWWVNLVFFAFGIIWGFALISFLKSFLTNKYKAYVYFYKIDNKPITIYKQIKGKYITIFLSKKQIFRKYTDGDWQEISYDEDAMMGRDLLFSKFKSDFNKDLDYIERKNGEQIVYVYNKELHKRTTIMTIQNGVLKLLEHCKLYYDDEAKLRINAVDLLTKIEINTERSCDIPKSFLEFCDSNGIDFPKENKYLNFV